MDITGNNNVEFVLDEAVEMTIPCSRRCAKLSEGVDQQPTEFLVMVKWVYRRVYFQRGGALSAWFLVTTAGDARTG